MSKYITLKVPGARKEEEFVVYPMTREEMLAKLQSDNRCVVVNMVDKVMVVGKRVAQYPRFEMCRAEYGATKHPAPDWLIEEIKTRITGTKIVNLV